MTNNQIATIATCYNCYNCYNATSLYTIHLTFPTSTSLKKFWCHPCDEPCVFMLSPLQGVKHTMR